LDDSILKIISTIMKLESWMQHLLPRLAGRVGVALISPARNPPVTPGDHGWWVTLRFTHPTYCLTEKPLSVPVTDDIRVSHQIR